MVYTIVINPEFETERVRIKQSVKNCMNKKIIYLQPR